MKKNVFFEYHDKTPFNQHGKKVLAMYFDGNDKIANSEQVRCDLHPR